MFLLVLLQLITGLTILYRLWSLVLTFPISSIDILCDLRNLLDACLRSTQSFLFLELMCLVSSLHVGHMFGWLARHTILSKSSLGMCELPASSLFDSSQTPLCEPCSRTLLASYICELVIFEYDLFGS